MQAGARPQESAEHSPPAGNLGWFLAGSFTSRVGDWMDQVLSACPCYPSGPWRP